MGNPSFLPLRSSRVHRFLPLSVQRPQARPLCSQLSFAGSSLAIALLLPLHLSLPGAQGKPLPPPCILLLQFNFSCHGTNIHPNFSRGAHLSVPPTLSLSVVFDPAGHVLLVETLFPTLSQPWFFVFVFLFSPVLLPLLFFKEAEWHMERRRTLGLGRDLNACSIHTSSLACGLEEVPEYPSRLSYLIFKMSASTRYCED